MEKLTIQYKKYENDLYVDLTAEFCIFLLKIDDLTFIFLS